MPDDRIAALLAGLPPPVASDAMPYPVLPGQQYAGGSKDAAVRATEALRRALGVGPTLTGVKATDDVLKQIEEALKLAPGPLRK